MLLQGIVYMNDISAIVFNSSYNPCIKKYYTDYFFKNHFIEKGRINEIKFLYNFEVGNWINIGNK